ncbi:flagellar hook-associated protein FlgL [Neokomagataea thailandica NBRC 106555]|uniref:Flagellin n=2 Tax=Neokomagataea TaxID=1223423 RepID=A0A4Y6V3I3_9PROT|nr:MULTISPECIES: flagellin [Neokomagataea]QDH24662.1 flagellin [Neokomagataea tanensis]GBR53906.1 flagellar hook-associated protein FlgL [Neokomagataea thailandica NBRC 106555]
MTGIVSEMRFGAAFFGLSSGINTLSKRQTDLQAQVSTGVTSVDYAGLGSARTQALAVQPALTQVSAWSGNVQNAQTMLSVGQSALSQISTISSNLTASISSLVGTPTSAAVASASQSAKASLSLLGALLNTQSNGVYVFSGDASTIAPIKGDLQSSAMSQAISASVQQLGTNTGQVVLQDSLRIAGNTGDEAPFSTALSGSAEEMSMQTQKLILGPGGAQTVGWVASQGGASTSETTGSPIRDLMRNLMVVASLSGNQVGSDSYNSLISGIQVSNNSVNNGLSDASAQLGVQQNMLSSQSTFLDQMNSALTSQLGQAKDADMASVSTQLTDTQNQLQASYSVIANMKSMTLANYI